MGKGTIVNHIADGKYNVTLSIDDSRAQQAITDLTDSINQLSSVILSLQGQKSSAYSMYLVARDALNVVIANYMAGTASREDVIKATTNTNSKYRLYSEYNKAWGGALLRKSALEKRKEYIENKLAENPEPTLAAWCADLTEDLSGEVGTIEIPNECTNDVQIRPGYDGEAVYDSTRDGQLQHVVSSSAAGVYYNYAMFPGWQKWMPTYRVGAITAKPTIDTAHVTLDSATSTAQNLDVNVSDALSDVPIVYMDCDGDVFEIGDRVVVEFIDQDHTDPRIIGFETNPKECEFDLISIRSGIGDPYITIHDGISGTVQSECKPFGGITHGHTWRGCTFDGTDFIAYNWTQKRIYKFDGILHPDICNLGAGFIDLAGYAWWLWTLAWDGTNLLASHWIAGGWRFLKYNGFSGTIIDSFDIMGAGLTVYGMCWDFSTNDLIVGGSYSVDYPFTGKIIKYNGFSNTIKQKLTYPVTAGDATWQPSACFGLSIKDTNLITWGGRHYKNAPFYDYNIRIHNGFSAIIDFSDPYNPTQANAYDMLVYPKNT